MTDFISINEHDVEKILLLLKPVVEKMTNEAPQWGNIGLTIIFNNGKIKRMEITNLTSIQFTDG